MSPPHVTVRVPATSANLGPGFDALGIALELSAGISLSVIDAPRAGRDSMERMVLSAAQAAARRAGAQPLSLRANVERSIPVGRGLGASAVARAAGIVGANALMGSPLSDDELLRIGAQLEGHADNIAPALFGGLRVVVDDGNAIHHVEVAVPDDLRIVLFVPAFSMPTHESRKALPRRVSREDAVYNLGRAALLVAAVTAGRYDALRAATQDRLHQPARTRFFPAMPALFQAALDAGAHAAYLSGGGSTIAAWVTDREDAVAAALASAAAANGVAGDIMRTRASREGARIIEEA